MRLYNIISLIIPRALRILIVPNSVLTKHYLLLGFHYPRDLEYLNFVTIQVDAPVDTR